MLIRNNPFTLQFNLGVAGVTPTVTISKDNAADITPSGITTEVGNGRYKTALTAGDMDADNIYFVAYSGNYRVDFLINTDQEALLPTAQQNAEALLASSITARTGRGTFGWFMRKLMSVFIGKSSGHPSAPVFRNIDDTADEISYTVDPNGNKLSVNDSP
jgi:hypothetical protein